MIHRGTLFGRLRHGLVALLFVTLVVAILAVHAATRARGSDATRCERFTAASVMRGQAVTGVGEQVVVIGDSWSAGLGLADSIDSWPSRLPGRVTVAGFSGSGFSAGASGCGVRVSFASRADAALARGADLVVVQGGLNDHDQPSGDLRAGFERLMAGLEGQRVVVVGPASAPSRSADVPRVDRLLERLAAEHGADYVRTSAWELPFLADRLHLTAAGHELFGDRVREALLGIGAVGTRG